MDEKDSLVRLEFLLQRVQTSGLRSLNSDELIELGHLYRRAASALSLARGRGLDDSRIEYLNGLVSRAYGYIYVAESKGYPSIKNFFTKDFPQTFRRNLLFILAAFGISLAAGLFAFAIVDRDPGKADAVLGPQASAMIDHIASRHTGHKNWMPEEERPVMSSSIMINNIQVSILAFATGILAGVGTFVVMFYNGLMLGVIAGAIKHKGMAVAMGFWAFVAPHGVIELTAIFISGGAGLMLGWAVINPGDRARGDALKLAGRQALVLVLGVASMLVIAGIIEGFFSPAVLPDSLKFLVAGLLGAAEFSYLFLAGSKSEPAKR